MSRRTERVNELLRKELSWLLAKEMNDPRLPLLVTITSVDISADLRQAKISISIMGDGEEKLATVRILQAASGFLRKELKPRLTLRHVPALLFQLDESIEEGAHMLQIMDKMLPPLGPSP